MEQNETFLISDQDKAPTLLQGHKDGVGIRLTQGRNSVVLAGDELHRLLEHVDRPPTTVSPARARIMSYPIHNHPSSD
jgi:hypothetical protein